MRRAVGEAGWAYLVLWDVDTEDAVAPADGGPTALEIEATVLSRVQGGSIILLHLGGWNTLEALPRIVEGLEAKGLQPVTLSELLSSVAQRLASSMRNGGVQKLGVPGDVQRRDEDQDRHGREQHQLVDVVVDELAQPGPCAPSRTPRRSMASIVSSASDDRVHRDRHVIGTVRASCPIGPVRACPTRSRERAARRSWSACRRPATG